MSQTVIFTIQKRIFGIHITTLSVTIVCVVACSGVVCQHCSNHGHLSEWRLLLLMSHELGGIIKNYSSGVAGITLMIFIVLDYVQ